MTQTATGLPLLPQYRDVTIEFDSQVWAALVQGYGLRRPAAQRDDGAQDH